MAEPKVGRGRFWRYNFKVLMGTGYWVLAIPVAASQIVTLWMMALSTAFGQHPATRVAELMTPVLSAFLVAHSLAPEYRSGVGAVLACKPLSLGKVLGMRSGLGMLAAVGLTLITLSVCSATLKPIEVGPPVLASLPSVFFLSGLALVFATIFRNPIGGFAVALGIWALDFAMGYGVHPLLSIQGLSASLDSETLADFWTTGKIVQLVVGAALWWTHSRLLSRVCRPPERADVLKIATASAAVAGLYCVSGAATVVGYAYVHRGALPQSDPVWLSARLQAYGPVPVARVFGPAFVAYVTPPAPNASDPKATRLAQLEHAASLYKQGLWADGIAYALGSEQEAKGPKAAVTQYLSVADRYSDSPFASKALGAILRLKDEAIGPDEQLLAARRLLADYRGSREVERAAEALAQYYPDRVKAEELLNATQAAEGVALPYRKPEWLVRRAELEGELDRKADALQHARQAQADAQKLLASAQNGSEQSFQMGPYVGSLASTAARAQQLQAQLQATPP